MTGVALLAVAGGAAGRAARASESGATEPRIDAIFREYDTTRSPGCALGVVHHGKLVFGRGYGMADLEHGVPLSTRSVFDLASTSKQFAAAVVGLLAQDGQLSLEDDVRAHLPELRDYGTPVRIRHLIHHTSGYRDYLELQDLAGLRDADWYDDAEVVELLARQRELNFPPNTEHLYSNSGYFLLSQLVLRSTGKSLRQVAHERLFEPLGMASTHFHDDFNEIVPARATGYAPRPGGGFALSQTTLNMVGDGTLYTTVEDLARWDQNFYEPRLGGGAGKELLDLLLRPGVLESGEELDYAGGLYVWRYRGLPAVSHAGAFVGFRSEMLRFPEQRLTVICLCNLSSARPTRLAQAVAELYLADQMGPPEPEEEDDESEGDDTGPRPQVGAAALEQLAGTYYSEELGVEYHLAPVAGGLELRVGRRDPLRLEPARIEAGEAGQPEVFKGSWLTVHFARDAGGRVTGFTLDSGRVKNLRFERR